MTPQEPRAGLPLSGTRAVRRSIPDRVTIEVVANYRYEQPTAEGAAKSAIIEQLEAAGFTEVRVTVKPNDDER